MNRRTFAEIHLKNIVYNFNLLKSLQKKSSSFFCPMIKSSAYGHGAIQVARSLIEAGAHNLGVAMVEEGVELRDHGIRDANVLIFGPFGSESINDIVDHRLTPVISNLDQLKMVASSGTNIDVHLKWNTGMNRLGLSSAEIPKVQEIINNYKKLQIKGLCTHLAVAEDYFSKDSFTLRQIRSFNEICTSFSYLNVPTHVLNSAGILAHYLSSSQEGLGGRPGIALYGVKPSLMDLSEEQQRNYDKLQLKPTMSLKSEIIGLHHLKKGERVSYGGTWCAPRSSTIGVLALGYADGYQRHLSNKGWALFRGRRVPIIGTVCMDYTMIDLSDVLELEDKAYREQVLLFGEDDTGFLPVEEVAGWINTIPYEIFTGISERVPRRYI